MSRTKTATIYCRISSDPTGQAAGVERQEAECRALAEKLGLQVGQVLVDNDTSATSGKLRPAFEALLAAKPAAVVVWAQDRLLRVARDLERVLDLGCAVHSVTAGTLDLSTPAGRAVARTVAAWSTYEIEQKKLREEAARRQRLAAGKRAGGGARPWGYSSISTMAIQETEAEVIRELFRRVADGESLAVIARDFNQRGIKGPQTKTKIMPQTLSTVIRNPLYAGLNTHQKQIIGEGFWTPIIPRAQWEAVQGMLTLPNRVTKPTGAKKHLLSGIAVCGTCQARVEWTKGPRAGGPSYYRCAAAGHFASRLTETEAVVLEEVAEILDQVRIIETMYATSSPQEPAGISPELLRDIEGLEARRTALAGNLELSEAALVVRLAAIEAKLSELHEQVAQEARRPVSLPSILREVFPDLVDPDQAAEEFRNADSDKQRRIISAVVTVTIWPQGRRGKAPFDTSKVVVAIREELTQMN